MTESNKKKYAVKKYQKVIDLILERFAGYESFIKKSYPNDSNFFSRTKINCEIKDYLKKLDTICFDKEQEDYEYAIHMLLESLECWNIMIEAKYNTETVFWNPIEESFNDFYKKHHLNAEIKPYWLTTKNPSEAVITRFIQSNV